MKPLSIIPALVTALTLTSCSDDINIISDTPDPYRITYTATTDNISRAAEVYGSTNTPDVLLVYARTSSDNALYIDGDRITRVGDSNSYADEGDPRFWPQSEALNFYACSAADKISFDGTDVMIANYTVAPNPADQVDLMYATAPGLTSGTVNLNFRHAMAQVVFSAKNYDLNNNIEISRIALGHITGTGTFILPALMTTTENVNGVWAHMGDPDQIYNITFDTPVVIKNSRETAVTAPDGDCKNALMLIPQVVKPWNGISEDDLNGSYIIMEYATVNKITGETLEEYSICRPFAINWQPGRRYSYTINFSSDPDGPTTYRQTASFDVKVSNL